MLFEAYHCSSTNETDRNRLKTGQARHKPLVSLPLQEVPAAAFHGLLGALLSWTPSMRHFLL